jgi:hypothetical protein
MSELAEHGAGLAKLSNIERGKLELTLQSNFPILRIHGGDAWPHLPALLLVAIE